MLSAVAVVVLAAGGGSYWALDRFVIDHVEITDVRAYEASVSSERDDLVRIVREPPQRPTGRRLRAADSSSTPVVTDTSYTSDDASVTISTVVTGSGDSTVTYYVADVDAGRRDRAAIGVREQRVRREHHREHLRHRGGQQRDLRDQRRLLRIPRHRHRHPQRRRLPRRGRPRGAGVLLRRHASRSTTRPPRPRTSSSPTGSGTPCRSGLPLVENGEIVDGIDSVEVDTNFGNHSIQGEQPRTAVGVIDANHLVFVVVDGRSAGYSAGVTMTGLAEIMQSLGAQTAYNLDGGGSSTMYFDGARGEQPARQGRGARHLRHPLHRRVTAVIVLIPALRARSLAGRRGRATSAAPSRICGVVVVDDGSGPAFAEIFAAAATLGATVLGYAGQPRQGLTRSRPASRTSPARTRRTTSSAPTATASTRVGRHPRASPTGCTAARCRNGARRPPVHRQGAAAQPVRQHDDPAGCSRSPPGGPCPDTQTGLRGYPAAMLGWLLDRRR